MPADASTIAAEHRRYRLRPFLDILRELRVHAGSLEGLRGLPSRSFDIADSRHVMELHSIDPRVLLTSRRYWSQFTGRGFRDLGEDYPSSRANIRAVFAEVFRVVRPGGVIVSQIARKKNSCLDAEFVESLGPASIRERPLGRLSSIVTVVR